MFSAGEASGDMHAAAVAAELKKNHPDIEMLGMGGPGHETSRSKDCL